VRCQRAKYYNCQAQWSALEANNQDLSANNNILPRKYENYASLNLHPVMLQLWHIRSDFDGIFAIAVHASWYSTSE